MEPSGASTADPPSEMHESEKVDVEKADVEKNSAVLRPSSNTSGHDPNNSASPGSDSNSGPNPNPNPDAATDLPPLDTSLRGWLSVVGGFACLFVSFGWATCIGVFQAYYSTHQLRDYNASAIGWIPSVETFFLFLGVPIFGGLFDYLGPTVLLIIGGIMHVGGLFGLANSETYVQIFFTQSVISAVGTGAIFVAGTTAVGTWFRDRRGLALGLISAGSAVGAVIGTAVIPVLFDGIGFAWTIRAVAITYFILLLVAVATTSRRPQPANRPRAPFRVSQLFPVTLLKSLPVLTLSIACFFYFFGVFIPYNYIVIEAEDDGDGPRAANNLLVILSATSTVGRVMPGWLGDRYGRFNTTVIFTMFSVVLALGLWIGAPWRTGRIAFAALYGFGSGTFVSMVPTLVAQVCPDMSKLGTYLGAVYILIAPSVLINQPIAGVLASAGESNERDAYVWLKVFCGVVMFVGVLGFMASRAAYTGQAGNPWKWGRV